MRALSISLVGLVCISQANAMELSPTTTISSVAMGVRTRIGFSYALNPDCSVEGPITVRILQSPKSGKFESLDEEGNSAYASTDQKFRCNLEKRAVSKYYYTSDDGFAGKDRLVIETFFPNGNSRKRTFEITVK